MHISLRARGWPLVATLSALGLALSGCGEDSASSADTTVTTDTSGAETTAETSSGDTAAPLCGDPVPALNNTTSVAPQIPSGADVSQLTGVSRAGESCTPPTPNASCNGPVSAATGAFAYPYCGLTAGGNSYTCNGCPDGHPALQGRWRGVGFCPDAGDPDVDHPPPTEFAELLFIDGNTWYSRIDAGGTAYEARGWYFCAEQPEHPNAHLFWVTTEVLADSEGATSVGEVHETDVPLTTTGQLLLFYFDSVGASTSVGITYCAIGEMVNGELCYDPYTRRP